jgi:hypothetical protein
LGYFHVLCVQKIAGKHNIKMVNFVI